MRWNKKFDETIESIQDKSHMSRSKYPNAHTDQEIKWIKDYHRRNPHISLCKLMANLKQIKDIQGILYLSTDLQKFLSNHLISNLGRQYSLFHITIYAFLHILIS